MKIERSAIVTVERDMAEEAWGVPLRYITGRYLQPTLTEAARAFIDTKRKEGEDYYTADDIHVYGPFPSKKLIDDMLSNEDFTISKQEQMRLARDLDPEAPWSHYLLHATFSVGHEPVLKGRLG